MNEQSAIDVVVDETITPEIKKKKFLIIRFSSIGDIVLTTPVIRCLKQQVANAEVHFLTKKSFHGLLADNPYIDKIFLLDDNWDLLLHELKLEDYDAIIDLHKNLRTYKVKRALKKVPSYAFDKLNIKKWLLTALKINLLPPIHIVDRNLATLQSFGVMNDGKGLDYFIPVKYEIKANDIPAQHQFGYIGLVIGAALQTKQLPIHKLKVLCTQIQHPIILLGGPEDKANGEAIAAIDPIKIYNACGKFKLNESADLVRKAKLIITHDTGLMHIAAAFKKPMISIWGNTIPAFGMTAYYGDQSVVDKRMEVAALRCRPCSKIGHDTCPKKHFKCMEQQDVDAITAAVKAMIAKA
jgi:heptosyltransferase-2